MTIRKSDQLIEKNIEIQTTCESQRGGRKMEKYIEFVVEGETPTTKETRIIVSAKQLADPELLAYLSQHYPKVNFTVKEQQ